MFRSPDSRASPRIPKHQVPEGPIHDFTKVIETTSPEEWQRRTSALETLVNAIPSSDDLQYFHMDETSNNNNEQWYNSPPILRHLAIPLSELIKDPRSTVVKRTCESCRELFDKCQVDARYLLKDIMPAIIQVHGSTVSVIRSYVQDMTVHAIAIVPCKMSMPLWLDRIKHDKSRTVREACCLYLAKAMEEWSTLMDEGYLTKDIYHQVGSVLIKTLRDASPQVRQQARKGLEIFHGLQPELFDHLMSTHPELMRDLRTKKVLLRIQAGENVGADDLSVASRSSRVSIASAPVQGLRANTSRNATPSRPVAVANRLRGGISSTNNRGKPPAIPTASTYDIPTTIGVATSATRSTSTKVSKGLGPPQRMVATSYSIDSVEEIRTNGSLHAVDSALSRNSAAAPFANAVHQIPLQTEAPPRPIPMSPEDVNTSFDTTDTDMSELQPITNTEELRQVAKSRSMNSRRSSLLLQDRLLRSSSNVIPEGSERDASSSHADDEQQQLQVTPTSVVIDSSSAHMVEIAHLGADEIANHPHLPEHTKIAHQLLEAHKVHVDQVMEVLKVEMDALKDFELILLEEGPRRPTEEEVLEYFESVGLCLEQRYKAGQILQRKMERISKGKQ